MKTKNVLIIAMTAVVLTPCMNVTNKETQLSDLISAS